MNIIADTNLILRTVLDDNADHFAQATALLDDAKTIIVSVVMLCELVWVLRTAKWSTADVGHVLRGLLSDPRVIVDRDMAERGLAILDAGGDFADGVIAADGARRGNATFATFDKQAARLLEAQGFAVTLLG